LIFQVSIFFTVHDFIDEFYKHLEITLIPISIFESVLWNFFQKLFVFLKLTKNISFPHGN